MRQLAYTIQDKAGIHARPAGLLAKAAKELDSVVTIEKADGRSAAATKLMAVMGLGVKCGDTVTVKVEGGDEDSSLAAYSEQSAYSSADFLKRLIKWCAPRGIRVECVQTDNGFECANRFSHSKRDIVSPFEKTAAQLGVRHKLIRLYTPRHNGKVERSHREDQKRVYSAHSFFSLADFDKQLALHNRRSNNLPMRPLAWLFPIEFLVQHV